MEDPTLTAQSGDILHGANNRNRFRIKSHYIIYLGPDENNTEHFLGMMLTHSPKFSNAPLEPSHFLTHSDTGDNFEVIFEKSYISPYLYHKKKDWQPFTKVGQLSEAGVHFILKLTKGQLPKMFPFNR
jgi:hypothetical protein